MFRAATVEYKRYWLVLFVLGQIAPGGFILSKTKSEESDRAEPQKRWGATQVLWVPVYRAQPKWVPVLRQANPALLI